MTRIHSRTGNRLAFTLVELMIVILIIAVLVSLLAAAVVNVMTKIPETQTRTEISEMEAALAAFMADYNLSSPPPSMLILNSTNPLTPSPVDNGQSAAFLTKMFGKNLGQQGAINWGGTSGSGTLTGEECLVFYLGGINNQGFSYNNMNPTPAAGQKMHGPYYTFQTNRLVAGPGGFLVYIDPWKTKTGPLYATLGGSPYAYFSSQGINNNPAYPLSSGYGAVPYFTAAGVYTNPNTYQIISAGKNGIFGTTGWDPTSGVAMGLAGADDQANFSAKVLGAPQQ